jgi:predicted dehydrogenase
MTTSCKRSKSVMVTATLFRLSFLLGLFMLGKVSAQASGTAPLRLAVAGIKHVHVPWILSRKDKGDIQLVGIYEPNKELAERYAKSFSLSPKLFYTDLAQMLDAIKPEAVVAFGSVYEHMEAVEACAPRGIHVMVEKPLATNLIHAKKMETLAKKHGIYLLTNYETSWYPTTVKTYQLVNDSNYVGSIKKVVVHDGHEGPKEIGLSKESLDWLIDPVQNGGGALIDFGCYGANLMTYLMKGEQPVSVTATTRQFKPAIYPKVDDEATIIVEYPTAQCIIQASWNWPFSRKDMEVYGQTGYVIAENNTAMRMRNKTSKGEQKIKVTVNEVAVYEDPFSYFADVIRGKIKLPENGLYSLATNVTVVRILEAARESAKTGKTVLLQNENRK